MGNQVCTDAKPFTFDDVLLTHEQFPGRKALDEHHPLVVKATQQLFEPFDHNIKAFSFSLDKQRTSQGRRMIVVEPCSLRGDVVVDASKAYLLLQIKRTDTRSLIKSVPCLTQVPQWALETLATFSPRGLQSPFGSSCAFRLGSDSVRYEHTIHVLNGRNAHQLCAAFASIKAIALEKKLLHDQELLRRLFYGFNAARLSDSPSPVHIGRLVLDSECSSRVIHLKASSGLRAVFQQHGLLRALHEISVDLPTDQSSSAEEDTASDAGEKDGVTADANDAAAASPPSDVPPRATFSLPFGKLGNNKAADEESPNKPQIAPPPNLLRLNLTGIRPSSDESQQQGHSSSSSSNKPAATVPSLAKAFAQVANNNNNVEAGSSSSRVSGSQPREEGEQEENDDDLDEVIVQRERLQKLRDSGPVATEILPFLFVGGEAPAKDRQQLLDKGITTVVNAAGHAIPNEFPDLFEYHALYLCDSPSEPMFSLFAFVCEVIDRTRERGGKVYVHCHQGVSRSCTLVLSYVMWHFGHCYDRAYQFVRERRTICSPNVGFIHQLQRWEAHLRTADDKRTQGLCYSVVPFSTDAVFPLVFRRVAAAIPSVVRGIESDYLMHPLALRGDGHAYHMTVDSRAVYVAWQPQGREVHLICGADADESLVSWAEDAVPGFLRYNFFAGASSSTSVNNHGEAVVYTPSEFSLRRVVAVRLSEQNSDAAALSPISSTALIVGDNVHHLPIVGVSGRSPEFEKLLTDDVRQHLDEHREDERLMLEGNTRRRRARDDAKQAADNATHQTAAAPAPRGLVQRGEEDSDDEGGDGSSSAVTVYQYPFDTTAPLADIQHIDDLLTENGYAVVVRGIHHSSSSGEDSSSRPHQVYLWLGDDFPKTEEELQQKYRTNLVDAGVRISSKTMLKDVEEVFVYERDEPGDMLLAFA